MSSGDAPIFRSIMDVTAEEWLAAMKLAPEDVPDAVIVEGSWWRQQRTDWRLGYLSDVRELEFPDIFWGRWRDKKIAFCCAYGAARTVEIIHLFGVLGTKLAVQIGTCGGLQAHLAPGDIILPEVVLCREGVAQMYGTPDAVIGSREWIDRAETLLRARDHVVYRGTHVTWSSLFTETPQMMEAWHHAGILSVEMETATTFAVARYFNMAAVSLVVVWDDLTRGRRFLDPLPPGGLDALNRSNAAVYETALTLAEQV
jgi:uridine phosphorylase